MLYSFIQGGGIQRQREDIFRWSRLVATILYILYSCSQSSLSPKVIATCLFKLGFSGFVFDVRLMVTKVCFNIVGR